MHAVIDFYMCSWNNTKPDTWSVDLGLIKIVINVDRINCFFKRHSKLFQRLRCLKTPYHIKIDISVTSVVSPVRNQPAAAIRERLQETLDEMDATGVMQKMDKPTKWVNSLVVIEKPKLKKLYAYVWTQDLSTQLFTVTFSTSNSWKHYDQINRCSRFFKA